jgi:SNF2 family DNA or RNA helicase
MPALLDIPIKVDLPAEAKKHYKMLEDQFIVKLQEGVVTASNAAVLSIKLRQCASGSIYDDDRNVHHVHAAKLDALEDLVEELAGDPLLIAVGFLHEVEAIRKHLKRDIPYLGGGVSPGRMDKIMTKWNMGWLPVLLAHPTSVAHGLNLQSGGRAICWFTLTFNSEEYMQLVRRVYRQGQARKVLNYHLLAKDTIDDYVLKAVNEKDRVQRNMLQELKTYYQVK